MEQKLNRRKIRENAMILLFEASLRDDTPEELFALASEIDDFVLNAEIKSLVTGTLAHADELDAIIQRLSPKRSLARIAKINLTLLRLALYESLYTEGTPTGAAISEAVRLAKIYSSDRDARFINGVLGTFAREQDGSEA